MTVTLTLFHPNTLARGDLDPVMVGAVLSMLIPPIVKDTLFPALSTHKPVRDCPAPSEDTV